VLIQLRLNLHVEMISCFLLCGDPNGETDRARFEVCFCFVSWWNPFVSILQSVCQFILVVCMLVLLVDYLKCASVWVLCSMVVLCMRLCLSVILLCIMAFVLFYYKCY
jgi:hypothetical protein